MKRVYEIQLEYRSLLSVELCMARKNEGGSVRCA